VSPVVACAVYLVFLLPVVAAGVWCWYRYSAPLLLDAVDADEMVVSAVHRLSTLAYALLALGFVAWQAPSGHSVLHGNGESVIHGWARVLFVLGLAHALTLRAFLRNRRRRERELTKPRVVWGPPAATTNPTPTPAAVYAPPPAYCTPAADTTTLSSLPFQTYTAPPGSFTPPRPAPLFGSQPLNEWEPPVPPVTRGQRQS
jgi:hypothetical protein